MKNPDLVVIRRKAFCIQFHVKKSLSLIIKSWLNCFIVLTVLFLQIGYCLSASSADVLKLAVTTTFVDSGLSKHLLNKFSEDELVRVKTIVTGTGQALRYGRSGEVDALIVHAKSAELQFVDSGNAISRNEILFNYFVFVGPENDPANISTAGNVAEVLKRISESEAPFVSRGDNSGTHMREVDLWSASGINIKDKKGSWYKSTGAGMGTTLNIVSATGGYSLVDHGTWLNFNNKANLKILYDKKSPLLLNQYSYLIINPEQHPKTNFGAADKLKSWLLSARGKAAINSFQVNRIQAFEAND